MTTVLYILMAALVFFIIGYLLSRTGCESSTERYLSETPVDPVTSDTGNCEDADIAAAQKAEADAQAAKLAEAAQTKADEEAAQAKAAHEAAQKQKDKDDAAQKAVDGKADKSTKVQESAAAVGTQAAVAKSDKSKASSDVASKKAEKAKTDTSSTESKAKESAAKADKDVKHAQANKKNITNDNATPEANAGTAPEGLLDAPRNGKKDNLTKIKGIGLKIDEALNGIGVYHFDQIAAWNEENMAWADSQLAFPGRAKRDDWVGQAKHLAEGKETEFSKRVEKGQVASSKKA